MARTNPFDRFELPPTGDVAELTDALRERAESAEPAERAEIRAAWEALTLHPVRRLELALTAVPETRPPLGRPPPRPPIPSASDDARLTLADLVDAGTVCATLPPADDAERDLAAPRRFFPARR
jgi:hypothetical protein